MPRKKDVGHRIMNVAKDLLTIIAVEIGLRRYDGSFQ